MMHESVILANYKYTNAQIHKYTNAQIHKHSKTQMNKYIDIVALAVTRAGQSVAGKVLWRNMRVHYDGPHLGNKSFTGLCFPKI